MLEYNIPPQNKTIALQLPALTMEEDALVSGVNSLMLTDKSVWPDFYATVRKQAISLSVWGILDPEIDDAVATARILAEPEPHIPIEWAQVVAMKQSDNGIADANQRLWDGVPTTTMWTILKDSDRTHETKKKEYRDQLKALGLMTSTMSKCVPKPYRHLIEDVKDREMLKKLQDRFSPKKDPQYAVDLRDKWVAHCKLLKIGVDIEAWVTRTEGLYKLLQNTGEATLAGDAIWQFLEIIQKIPEMHYFYANYYNRLRIEGERIETLQFLDRLKQNWKALVKNPAPRSSQASRTAANSGAFSTLQGAPEAQPPPTTPAISQETQEQQFARKKCPCGRNHTGRDGRVRVWTCWYINPATRPTYDGFTIDEARVRRATEALNKESKAYKEWVKRKVEEFNKQKTIEKSSSETHNNSTTSSYASLMSYSTTGAIRVLNADYSTLPVTTKDWWILDCGSTGHVCNQRDRFIEYNHEPGHMRTGDHLTPFDGIGKIVVYPIDPESGKPHKVVLSDVVYSPTFQINLVSESRLGLHGICHDGVNRAVSVRKPHKILWKLTLRAKLWTFDPGPMRLIEESAPKLSFHTRNGPRNSRAPLLNTAGYERWHERLGHIGHRRLLQAEKMASGMEILPKKEVDAICEVCLQKDAKQQISRRPIPTSYGRTGRVYFDIVFMPEYGGKFGYLAHFYIEHVRFHIAYALQHKSDVRSATQKAIAFIERWLKLRILALFSDNESGMDNEIKEQIAQIGLQYDHSPAGHAGMNGPSERSGGVITMLTRALILEGGLPGFLWPFAMRTAVYLLNRLPTWIQHESKWIIPLQEVRRIAAPDGDHSINLSNLRVYGCAVYARILNIPKRDKLSPRAKLGYLVGYVSSNVWHVWFPEDGTEGKVEAVRDAVFIENRRYRPPLRPTMEDPIPEMPESNGIITEIDAMTEFHHEMEGWGLTETELPSPTPRLPNNDVEQPTQPANTQVENSDSNGENSNSKGEKPDSNGENSRVTEPQTVIHRTPEPINMLPTPDATPGLNNQESDDDDDAVQLQQELGQQWQYQPEIAPMDIHGDIDSSNIIEGSRSRRSTRHNDYQSHFAHAFEEAEPPEYRMAYTTALYTAKPSSNLHIDDLPPPPKRYKDVQNHPLRAKFMQSMKDEIDGLTAAGTYELVDRPTDVKKDVLPLMWVFTYKTDADGYLLKTKARICVRGDLQMLSTEEKRAATLAAKTARLMLALTAAFNLDTRQMDAINAFLNSLLTEEVYTTLPDGFKCGNKVWKLVKALYGLRKSPRLWHQEATRVLKVLGLTSVPEDPCLFTGKGVLVFFYVDDIIVVSLPSAAKEAARVCDEISRAWKVRDLGEVNWFLGIRILRDREAKKLWLCQDAYLDQMAAKFHLNERHRKVTTPLPNTEDIKPFQGIASQAQVKEMQQKTGSAQYPANQTRPDVAIHMAKLAQHLTNPGERHLEAVDRVMVYMHQTKHLAIEYGSRSEAEKLKLMDGDLANRSLVESVVIASDASFGDNADRKSSYGYICKIYGGAVDWKAAKQSTVSTSTTEAEFLAMTEAAKTLLFWRRLLGAIGFEPSHPIPLHCDNHQTIRLLLHEPEKFSTKLRHVDIARHWLRERVQNGDIDVKWVPTAVMPADGLTKVLPKQEFDKSVEKLGLRDISRLLKID